MARKPFGVVSSLEESGEIKLPLVICKEKGKFVGFVPGFIMTSFVESDIEVCKTKLKEYAKNEITKMAKNKEPFPFFPTEEEIFEDFKDVKYLEFIKLKKSK